jgi:dienelactone hydrolase
MELRRVEYHCDGLALTGYLADGSRGAKVPGVLVAHEGPGVGEHVRRRALMLAQQGYVAFALDMYGVTGLSLDEARVQSHALMADAAVLRRRARAGLAVLSNHSHCDAERLAAIGFCLGGIVALELARDEAPIRCAIGFHPGLKRPAGSTTGRLSAKVLMMLGDDDPIVPQEDRAAFAKEMSEAEADWQLLTLGGVGHSYTNPDIDAFGFKGFAYDAQADRRAWRAMLALLNESFA